MTGQCKICGNSNIGLVKRNSVYVLKEHTRSTGRPRRTNICPGSGQLPK
jgi:hypothetical protein